MGRCVICRKETNKTLFKKAIVHTYICSKECLAKYFGHKVMIQETFSKSSDERDYWIE